MGKRTLVIDRSSVFQSKYENVIKFNESLFEDVYLEAYDNLIRIVEAQEELNNKGAKARNFDINNVIAFVGDKGSGKTSCMKNFRRSLKEKDNRFYERSRFYNSKGFDKNQELENNNILKKRYELLNVIDSSLFSVNDSLIEIVVGLMFNSFKDKCAYDDNELNLDKNQEVMKAFEKVYKSIKTINKNSINKDYDNLKALAELSSSISLKEEMSKLVEYYINSMNLKDNDNREGYLVISIDNIDMNLESGYKILEDINKYLIIPNVIVLLCANVKQLEEIIQQRYLVNLKENGLLYKEIDNVKENKKDLLINYKTNIENKTKEYLEKIIPLNRRITIPNLNQIDENNSLTLKIDKSYSNNIKRLFNYEVSKDDLIITFKDFKENLESIEEYNPNFNPEYNWLEEGGTWDKSFINLRKFIEFVIYINKKSFK